MNFKKILVLAVMFAASVVCGQIDWTAQRITISTAEELHEFRDTANAGRNFSGQTVLLLNDINLNGNQENQWVPIGNHENIFRGTFDGSGNVISGVYVNNSEIWFQGLFGVAGGVIRNLGVVVNITGGQFVGGLVASGASFGLIENCVVIGTVEAVNGTQVGGLVGDAGGSVNRNSYAIVDVIGHRSWTGGLAGVLSYSGRVLNSYALGKVTENGGGLVGGIYEERGSVINSFHTNDIRNNGRGTLITEAQLKNAEFLSAAGWDFTNTWGIDPTGYINNGFPYLQAFAITITWDEPNFTFNGERQIPAATATTANGDTLELIITTDKEAINAGSYIATATLKIPREFPFLLNATKVFEIKPKSLKE
ncbi:MAG: hypothetical protein FWE23_09230, partial [Chitinivibrionia bacterium]|nr:hypothetical protein [Chitinivibrionia bacterium]